MTTETSLADQYTNDAESMHALRDGRTLRAVAERVAARLPPGRLTLLSTSAEGAALTAVCAASRRAPTSWQLIHLAYPPCLPSSERIVVIEPIDPGHGWEAAVRRRYPDAVLLFAQTAEGSAAAIAA
jgi:hypothetical protein